MKRLKRWLPPTLSGIGYGGLVVLFSRLLVRNLGSLIRIFGGSERMRQTVGQLKTAHIVSPWVLTLLLCGLLGGFLCGIRKPKLRIWCYIAAGIFLIPCILAEICFTRVNGIRVLDLLGIVLPALM